VTLAASAAKTGIVRPAMFSLRQMSERWIAAYKLYILVFIPQYVDSGIELG
jgi:hypothetical protein